MNAKKHAKNPLASTSHTDCVRAALHNEPNSKIASNMGKSEVKELNKAGYGSGGTKEWSPPPPGGRREPAAKKRARMLNSPSYINHINGVRFILELNIIALRAE